MACRNDVKTGDDFQFYSKRAAPGLETISGWYPFPAQIISLKSQIMQREDSRLGNIERIFDVIRPPTGPDAVLLLEILSRQICVLRFSSPSLSLPFGTPANIRRDLDKAEESSCCQDD